MWYNYVKAGKIYKIYNYAFTVKQIYPVRWFLSNRVKMEYNGGGVGFK